MSKKLLEQIIRNVLNEGRISIDVETLTPTDDQLIKQAIQTRLKIDPTKRSFETLDGFRIVLQRIGGRIENPETDSKTYSVDPLELQSQVLMKLNSLKTGGVYQKMTGPDYVWFITTDLRLNDKRDERRPKEERIFAKYAVIAAYVKTSLLVTKNPISSNLTGYIDTLRNGALVFGLNKINISQWTRSSSSEVEFNEPLLSAPYGNVSFGDTDSVVKSLYSFFNLTKVFGFEPTSKFGCELKGAIEQFQIENIIPNTGNYDEKTSEKARGLKISTYEFKDIEAVKRLTKQCNIEQQVINQQSKEIIIPENGFKYKTTQNDLEFYKVQELMLKYFENILKQPGAIEKLKKAKKYSIYEKLKTALQSADNHGDYGDATKAMVKFLKDGLGLTTSSDVVENDFINRLK